MAALAVVFFVALWVEAVNAVIAKLACSINCVMVAKRLRWRSSLACISANLALAAPSFLVQVGASIRCV